MGIPAATAPDVIGPGEFSDRQNVIFIS